MSTAYSNTALGVDRRRRLFASLSPVLPGEQLWQALWLWEREFAEKAPFAISGYAQRLSEVLGVPDASQSLLDSVTQGIQGPGEGLPEDPISQMLENVASTNGTNGHGGNGHAAAAAPPVVEAAAPSPPESPQDAVFNAMLESFQAGLERKSPGAATELRRHLASGADVAANARGTLASWAKGEAARVLGMPTNDMAIVINAAYVWSCEEIGPTTVDRILGDAMRAAESLDAAASFSPRQLL